MPFNIRTAKIYNSVMQAEYVGLLAIILILIGFAAMHYTIAPGTVNLANFGQIAAIKFVKTSENLTQQDIDVQNNTFQIGEVRVQSSTGQPVRIANAAFDMAVSEHYAQYFGALNIADSDDKSFASSEGPSEVHTLTMTLAEPTVLGGITVVNRVDCCWDRLAGVVVQLVDSWGTVKKEFVLSNAAIQQL